MTFLDILRTAVFALLAWHLVVNRRWFANLAHGRYDGRRVLKLILHLVLVINIAVLLVTSVVISWRRTAAAPLMPPPLVRTWRAAALRSRARLMVVAWRSPAGPARSMSSRYTVEAQDPSSVPWRCHHSISPEPPSGRVRSHTCRRAIRPDRQVVASTRPQVATRRSCSPGSRSTNAGCETPTIAVRVW